MIVCFPFGFFRYLLFYWCTNLRIGADAILRGAASDPMPPSKYGAPSLWYSPLTLTLRPSSSSTVQSPPGQRPLRPFPLVSPCLWYSVNTFLVSGSFHSSAHIRSRHTSPSGPTDRSRFFSFFLPKETPTF